MHPHDRYHNVFEGETRAGSQQDSFRNPSLWTQIGKCRKLYLRIAQVSSHITFPPASSRIQSGEQMVVLFVSGLL